MGANFEQDSLFKNEALVGFSFGLDFDLAGARTVVERSGARPSRIILVREEAKNWPITPHLDRDRGEFFISNNEWRVVLGRLMFNLKDTDENGRSKKFRPTFRALISYFVRRQLVGGFSSPMKQSNEQQLWDQQVAVSYLLGTDWTIPQTWQIVREREKTLKELKKAAKDESLAFVGTTADLRTKLTIAEEKARQLREVINSYRVLPEYETLEKEASELTRDIGRLADENTLDLHLIADLEQSRDYEEAPPLDNLEFLYKEIGQVLPESVIKRFD